MRFRKPASGGRTGHLLRSYPLPASAQAAARNLTHQHENLALNRAGLDETTWLAVYATAKAPVAAELVYEIPTARCLQAIIDSNDKRVAVIDAVCAQWLPVRAQRMKIAKLKHADATGLLNTWGKLEVELGVQLAHRSRPLEALQWLDSRDVPVTDAIELFDKTLAKLDGTEFHTGAMPAAIASLVRNRAELVPTLLASQGWAVATYAALDPACQQRYVELVEMACTANAAAWTLAESVGRFVTRPEHDLRLRQKAYDMFNNAGKKRSVTLAAQGVLPVRDSAPQGSLSSLTVEALDNLLHGDPDVMMGIWLDIAVQCFDRLDGAQREMLVHLLGRQTSEWQATLSYMTASAALQPHLDSNSWATRAIGDAARKLEQLNDSRARASTAAIAEQEEPRRRKNRPGIPVYGTSSPDMTLHHLCRGDWDKSGWNYLVERLGDDEVAWSLAFALIDEVDGTMSVSEFADLLTAVN